MPIYLTVFLVQYWQEVFWLHLQYSHMISISYFVRNLFKCFDLSNQLIIITYSSSIKMNNPKQNQFDELLKAISIDYLYKKIVSYAQKKYLVKHLGLSTLNPSLVVKLVQRNMQKTNFIKIIQNNHEEQINETAWALNQFKIFVWISVCYAYINNKELQHFNIEDYQFLQSLFTRKSLQFIQYHTKSIIKQYKNIRKSWTQQQIDILIQVIRTQKRKQNLSWSEISFELFLNSQKRYYRTPQKCRQKWFNHLSPQVNRNKWSVQEDIHLFESIAEHGLKWALISKKFDGKRTQHMIKNRYNSLIKKYQTKVQKVTSKKLTQKIISDLHKKLNPLTSEQLSFQMQQQHQCEQLSNERSVTQGTIKVEEQDKETIIEYNKGQRLNSFDLQEILFNEEINFQDSNIHKRVQMVQIQMYGEEPRLDQYLSAFLF